MNLIQECPLQIASRNRNKYLNQYHQNELFPVQQVEVNSDLSGVGTKYKKFCLAYFRKVFDAIFFSKSRRSTCCDRGGFHSRHFF